MKKYTLAFLLIGAFLAGGIFTNLDIALAAATNTSSSGDNAWAKLVARVSALEAQPDQKIVVIHDDEAGHALGWNPTPFDSLTDIYHITAPDVHPNSFIDFKFNNAEPSETCNYVANEGSFRIFCSYYEHVPLDGMTLTYIVTNP